MRPIPLILAAIVVCAVSTVSAQTIFQDSQGRSLNMVPIGPPNGPQWLFDNRGGSGFLNPPTQQNSMGMWSFSPGIRDRERGAEFSSGLIYQPPVNPMSPTELYRLPTPMDLYGPGSRRDCVGLDC
jgi:hypothetical protein